MTEAANESRAYQRQVSRAARRARRGAAGEGHAVQRIDSRELARMRQIAKPVTDRFAPATTGDREALQ